MSDKLLENNENNSDWKPQAGQVQSLRGVENGAAAALTDPEVVALSMDSFPANVALPCNVYLKVNGKYVLFRSRGERLATKRLMELTARGATTFYLHQNTWRFFCAFLEQNGAPANEPQAKAQHVRQLMLVYGRELERVNRATLRELLGKIQQRAGDVATLLRSNPAMARELLSKIPQTSSHFSSHALNTAVFAGLIGIRLGFSDEDLRQLIFASMVHDIGKLALDARLLVKAGALSAEEQATLKTHPRAGAEALQTYLATPAVIQTALQHHERIDGKGYPHKLKGDQIHPFARICAIADTFDSLTSDRPHRAKVSASEALRIMAADTGRFDPKYLIAIPAGE